MVSKFKKKLRTIEAKNWQKSRTASLNSTLTGYKKRMCTPDDLCDRARKEFECQLCEMGLTLRETRGDGNCLFRALADQMDGNGNKHLCYRQEAAKYMYSHQSDFEPFIEDCTPFKEYVCKLQRAGTYAGNDAIVAFARRYSVNVIIHQLCAPLWIIEGGCCHASELHIAYYNGDHYASVRKLGDDSSKPAKIWLKDLKKTRTENRRKRKPSRTEVCRMVEHIIKVTECMDRDRVECLLEQHNYDVDQTIVDMTECNPCVKEKEDCKPKRREKQASRPKKSVSKKEDCKNEDTESEDCAIIRDACYKKQDCLEPEICKSPSKPSESCIPEDTEEECNGEIYSDRSSAEGPSCNFPAFKERGETAEDRDCSSPPKRKKASFNDDCVLPDCPEREEECPLDEKKEIKCEEIQEKGSGGALECNFPILFKTLSDAVLSSESESQNCISKSNCATLRARKSDAWLNIVLGVLVAFLIFCLIQCGTPFF